MKRICSMLLALLMAFAAPAAWAGSQAVLCADFTLGDASAQDAVKRYTVEIEGELSAEALAKALSELTGLDFSIAAAPAPDGLAVDWAKDSTLVAGLDDRAQKEEFFMYDVESLSWFMMDSLRATLKENLDIENVYYTMDGGKDLTLENLSPVSSFEADQPYMGSAFYCAQSNGAGQAEVTIDGIGERAGNASLEEVVMALDTRREYLGMGTSLNLRQIYRTCRLVSTVVGQKIPPNKPVVGRNAFSHEAGIHQHGVLKNPLTYEIMSPDTIGIYDNDLVLGKHSGKHAFVQRVEELGYSLPGDALEKAFSRFLALADRKKTVTNKDIEAIVSSVGYSIPETYRLHSFVVNSGTVISATAVVKLIRDGEEIEHVARGDGPIDAAFKAIDRIVKVGYQLVNYNIHSVTEGEDAQGEVVVKLKKGDHTVTGRGLSTDIFEASIKAYLNAVNKIIAQ